jgi:hypothetical protein
MRRVALTTSGAEGERLQRFQRHLVGLRRYLHGNTQLLFNYGPTRRGGTADFDRHG